MNSSLKSGAQLERYGYPRLIDLAKKNDRRAIHQHVELASGAAIPVTVRDFVFVCSRSNLCVGAGIGASIFSGIAGLFPGNS